MSDVMKSFKVEVIADSSGVWAGNALRFRTELEAERYAVDLMGRWLLVREWRVVPSTDDITEKKEAL
jgi:hypothetical protein